MSLFMKRKFFIVFLMAVMPLSYVWAGGLMTNTNYHIAFDRMFARGATFDIDAAFSNPAGLAWGHEGWQFSLNFQKPWQNRDIETTMPNFLGSNFSKKYNGKASAPIVPALFAAYKKDRWTVSTMIGIVGSGGFVKYEDGVPMFNIPITAMMAQKGLMPGQYVLDSEMKGKQYIYGGQLNLTYKITDFLSAAVGIRANYYDGYYRGHVVANHNQLGNLVNLRLDCNQRGWGFNPIISADFHKGPLTIAARYEFRTKLNVPNDTKELVVGMSGQDTDVKALAEKMGTAGTVAALSSTALGSMASKITGYLPDEKTRYDMPSLLSVAVGYEFSDQLRASVEYHFFDDKNVKMANDRQKELTHGTHEILAGVEYDINKTFTVSAGGQRTDYGLSDSYQSHTSFACDSYSIGFGGAVNLNEHIRLNVSYFTTLYSDYEVNVPAGNPGYLSTGMAGKDTFSRTNNVVGIGIDYKF